MQILVISGFLGAGKTSFIKAMSKAVNREFVIVENEFSDLNIDGPVLEAEKEEGAKLTIKELTEGCICCSSKMDFRSTILTIANSLNPDILLVEPSGVAFPSRILNDLRQISYENIKLLEPITIVDGESYQSSRREFKNYFDDQIKSAKHIIISKSEKYSNTDFENIERDLSIGEGVNFPKIHYSNWNKQEWRNLLINDIGESVIADEIEADTDIVNMGFRPFKARTPNEVAALMHEINTGRYGYIIRSKGYFRGEKQWFRYDYVNGTYLIGSCPPMPDTRAVVIGKNLNRKLLENLFNNTATENVKSSSLFSKGNSSSKKRVIKKKEK